MTETLDIIIEKIFDGDDTSESFKKEMELFLVNTNLSKEDTVVLLKTIRKELSRCQNKLK